jgi:PAS domain S-box-containing protein
MREDQRGWLLRAVATLCLVLVLGAGAVQLAPHGSVLAAWWPSAGVAVAFRATTPPGRRAGFVAALGVVLALAALLGGRTPGVAVALGAANAASAGVAIAVLGRRTPRRVRLRSLEDLWLLVLAALLGGAVAGVLIGATLAVALGAPLWSTAATVTAAGIASVLLVSPLGLDVAVAPVDSGRLERAAQVVLGLGVLLLVFGPDQQLPLDFLPIPLLMWGAMRLPLRAVTVELLLVGVVTSMATSLGHGPIAHDLVQDRLGPETATGLVQAYLATIALVVLPLALAGAQRRDALARALAGEERFRRGFSDSLIGMLLLRAAPAGLVVDEVNAVAAEQLGSEAGQLLGRPWGSGLTADDRAAMSAACDDILAGRTHGWVREVRLAGTEERWARLAASALERPGGERMLSVQLVDLTGQRQAQRSLEDERDFTAAILDTTNTLIIVLDRLGRVVRFNPAAERLSGYRSAAVLGTPVWRIVGPALGDRLHARLGTGQGGVPWTGPHQVEDEWVLPSGTRRTLMWSCADLESETADSHMVLSGIDVTDERLAQRLVDQVLAATTGTSIIGTDHHGVITFYNPGAERLLGWTAEEVVGRETLALFHDPEELERRSRQVGLAAGFGLLVAGVQPGHPEKRDWNYVRKDGATITMSLTLSAMTSASGRVVGYLGVAEDVTERRRVEDMLRVALAKERDAVERLNDVDRAKTDFVSTVSHELRTPITSVLGYTAMLQRGSGGPLTDRQAKLLSRVESNGVRLQLLIEDLLTLSRIEAGTFALRVEPVDLRELVLRCADATETARQDRSIGFGVEPGDELLLVSGDADQLDRAVVNLLTNAIKFTPDGGDVRVRLGASDGSAVLVVEDTGIGIPEADQHRLFERFFRSSTAYRRAIPGTGLGLSIVRTIVRGHGGTVEVTSREDEGSRFEVRLPLMVSGEDGSAGPRSDESARSG